jgi:hypothetical protein
MAILDDTLAQIVDAVKAPATDLGMVRARGGLARGVAWAEVSGRAGDGAWIELRVHHRPTDQRVQAGMLAYQPLSRGGRTIVLGETSQTYRNGPEEVSRDVSDEIKGWLALMTPQEGDDGDAV